MAGTTAQSSPGGSAVGRCKPCGAPGTLVQNRWDLPPLLTGGQSLLRAWAGDSVCPGTLLPLWEVPAWKREGG